MSRSKPDRPIALGTLLSLLFAFVLVGAACGSPDVESDEATEASEDQEEVVDQGEDEADESEVAVEADVDAEEAAMGEDDTMGEDDENAEPTTTIQQDSGSTANSNLGSAELTAAFEAGTGDRFSLPFMYVTVDQDCDGCAETMSLYYVPSEAKPSILTLETAYVDGVAQSDFSGVDPVLQAGDPRRVAEQLTDTDADFGIDPVSGIITSWTLDQNTVTMRCLQVDTRPVDMRAELCENSLIG